MFADDAPDTTAAETKTPNRSFAHFGISFRPPAGWREQMRDSYSVIGWWMSPADPNAKPAAPQAEIRVEANKAADITLATAAKGLAQQWDAKVAGPTTLGGDPALRITGAPPEKNESKRPVEAVVCKHGKFVYLIMVGVTPGGDGHDALETLRDSWKWIAFEPPSKQLGFGRQPYRIFGKVLIDLPALVCLEPIDDPSREARFAMPNPQAGGAEWMCFAQLVPRSADLSFDEQRDRLLETVKQKMKPDPEPAWESVKGAATLRFITNRFTANVPGKLNEKPERSTEQWGMIDLDKNVTVLIEFPYVAGDASDGARYETAARKIVASIRPAPQQLKPPLKKQ